MAYIYRYQLKDLNLRARINLQEYDEQIESMIDSHFEKNLKDKVVQEKYFEFKLYDTVHQSHLQKMGKRLKKLLSIQDENYGFTRMEQNFYALVYSNTADYDKHFLHIEFVDLTLIDNQQEYDKQAREYFKPNDLFYESKYREFESQIITNYYLDVLDAYVDRKETLAEFETGEEIACFSVRGYLRTLTREELDSRKNRGYKIIELEECIDYKYIANGRSRNNSLQRVSGEEVFNCLEISSISNQKNIGTKEEIEKRLELYLTQANQIEALENIQLNEKIEFIVHNVGQGLATSLSYKDKDPFLYFDFGMSCGNNKNKKPKEEIQTPIKSQSSIIISHNHQDHWYRVVDEVAAYSCNWYITEQDRRVTFKKKLAEIVAQGGDIRLINKGFSFKRAELIYGCKSKRKRRKISKHYHATGLALILEVFDSNGKELNILIAGDQKYVYIDDKYLKDMDILVASHHGGSYSWSKKDVVPSPRNGDSKVIYSYGEGNTYKHPTKESDYKTADWRNEHHTPKDGDFKIEFIYK